MSIKYPNILTSLPSTAFSNVSGQTALPVAILDQNNTALANPVNPPVSVSSNLTLNGVSDSGNIYEITGLTANITITLPTAAAGYNYTFIGNNTTSYTVTFSNGTMLFNGISQSSLTLDLSGKNAYKFICDGTNWYVNAEPSYGVSTTPTANQIPVANASGVLNLSALTLLTNARQTAVFTQNGTWTVPNGVTTIYVSGCGGGAGGGGGNSSGGGRGGGAGICGFYNAISVTAGSSLTITIGAGGAGDAANGTGLGNAGATTTLANGSTILVSWSGGNSFYMSSFGSAAGGSGASSPFGVGGVSGTTSANGGNAQGYGAGGGGGGGASPYYAGGNGAPGILIIQW